MSLTLTLINIHEEVGMGEPLPQDVREYLMDRLRPESILADLVNERFREMLPRLEHLCSKEPKFNKTKFAKVLRTTVLPIKRTEELVPALVPLLTSCVTRPGAGQSMEDFVPIYNSIIRAAVQRMWKRISALEALSKPKTRTGKPETGERPSGMTEQSAFVVSIQEFQSFARDTFQQIHNSLLDTAPPVEHIIDNETHKNPFLLVRAEDFNHNYARLARLFQHAPEFASIRSRTDNVFIEGGRGTGKSMILRRLTAQATVAAKRLDQPNATFADISEDYFGVYVKLTRGYYEQFEQGHEGSAAAALLAQHEINIEVFDAFVDALFWLHRENALPDLNDKWEQVAKSLSTLFPQAKPAQSLGHLRDELIRWEQDQVLDYLRDVTFGRVAEYRGSAQTTVGFMRQLSTLFRSQLFPKREVRLFLLFDEFETLTRVQQQAVNTVMKMRMPDLTMKVGVRKAGRRTQDTFTEGDPIQQPRDYIEVRLDYDVRSQRYATLLAGIAAMRLREAKYENHEIEAYLGTYNVREEASETELQSELLAMWRSGTKRKNVQMNDEFRQKYTSTAVYRLRGRKNRRKLFFGFKEFVLLSSGITSNFIELCKYAFYFALEEGIPLKDAPLIPVSVQTDAVYAVSQRLFGTIDGNVPRVGAVLQRLLTDLGSILRARLMNHTSDPEANRINIEDYDQIKDLRYEEIADVLERAVVWSVLHMQDASESFRPRSRRHVRTAEYLINRIYCPALEISPRARWRTPIKLADLAALIEPRRRKETHARLVKALGHVQPDDVEDQPSFLEDGPQ